MAGYSYVPQQYYYNTPEVQFANELSNSSINFANTMNSRVDVASHDSRYIIVSASHYSDNASHRAYYNAENCMQKPMSHNMSALGFNSTASNMQHVNHYTSVEQGQVPIYNYQGQTSVVSSAVQYETSHAANSYNIHGGVSPIYSSAAHIQFVNPSGGMPMNEKIGHANTSAPANCSQMSYATQYGSDSHNSVSYAITSSNRINEISAPYSNPNIYDSASYASNNADRIIENSAPYLSPNMHNLASYVFNNDSRVNANSASCAAPSAHDSASYDFHNASRISKNSAPYVTSSIHGSASHVTPNSSRTHENSAGACLSLSDSPSPSELDMDVLWPDFRKHCTLIYDPQFVKFNGGDGASTWEHINRYVAKLEGATDLMKSVLFPWSLAGAASLWFKSLSDHEIYTWSLLEQKFHDRFSNDVKDDSDVSINSCSESVLSKEIDLVVEKRVKHKGTAQLDFSKAKGPITLASLTRVREDGDRNGECDIIEQCSVAGVETHPLLSPGQRELKAAEAPAQAANQNEVQTSDCPVATTRLSGAPDCLVAPTGLSGAEMLSAAGPDSTSQTTEAATSVVDPKAKDKREAMEHHRHHQEGRDMIRVKPPRLSSTFNKVKLTSALPSSQSDHVSSVDKSISDIILHNSERSIEIGNLLVNNKMVSKGIGRCSIRIRKADNSNMLTFKFDPSLLPKFLSTWFVCGNPKSKRRKPKMTCVEKADDNILASSKSSCQETTSKCMAEWICEKSEPFVCPALKPSPQKDRLKKIKYTFDLTLSDHIFDALLEHNLIRIVDHRVMPSPQSLEVETYCKLHNSFDHNTSNCNMFRRLIQSAINKGRLRFAENQEDDQLSPIGRDGSSKPNRLNSSKDQKTIDEESNSSPPSDGGGSVCDVHMNSTSCNDSTKVVEKTLSAGGQESVSSLNRGPIHPAGQGIPDCPVMSTGLSGATPDYPAATTRLSGGGHVKPDMPNMPNLKYFGGTGRNQQKGKRPKITSEQLLAKYLRQNEAKGVDQTGNVKSSKTPLKSSRSPPMCRFEDWDWQGEGFHAVATYSPFEPPMPMQFGSAPTYFHPYSSWGWYDSNSYSSSHFRPHNVEYSAPSNSDFGKQPYNKDRFIPKNRSGAQNKNKVVKQVYVVKKDNRKGKGSDLNSYVAKPNKVLDTSASSAKTVEKSASNIVGTKSEPRNFNVPNVDKDVLLSKTKSQPRSSLGLSNWHKKKLEKLSACELKKRNMTWVPKGSSQAQSKDGARAKSEMDASKKKKAKISTEMFAPNHQSYWSSHHPYFSVVPHIGMSSQGMFGYPSWHYFNPYMSSCYGGMQPNYYAYG